MDSEIMITHRVLISDLLASSVPRLHKLNETISFDNSIDTSIEVSEDRPSPKLNDLSVYGTKGGVLIKRTDGTVYTIPWVYFRACMLSELAKSQLAARGIAVDNKVEALMSEAKGSKRRVDVDLDELLGATRTALQYLPLVHFIAEKL